MAYARHNSTMRVCRCFVLVADCPPPKVAASFSRTCESKSGEGLTKSIAAVVNCAGVFKVEKKKKKTKKKKKN